MRQRWPEDPPRSPWPLVTAGWGIIVALGLASFRTVQCALESLKP